MGAADYDAFIKAKAATSVAVGFEAKDLGGDLFDFQRAIVEWACRRGRAAIFADTGLGKTAMQVGMGAAGQRAHGRRRADCGPLVRCAADRRGSREVRHSMSGTAAIRRMTQSRGSR
jgi:hypothetical protein